MKIIGISQEEINQIVEGIEKIKKNFSYPILMPEVWPLNTGALYPDKSAFCGAVIDMKLMKKIFENLIKKKDKRWKLWQHFEIRKYVYLGIHINKVKLDSIYFRCVVQIDNYNTSWRTTPYGTEEIIKPSKKDKYYILELGIFEEKNIFKIFKNIVNMIKLNKKINIKPGKRFQKVILT